MKLDLSKAGLKRFFLYHAEKLILGLALALMGVFFWLGYSVKPFSEKTPSDLNTLADNAGRYIVNPSSWEEVRQHENRQGDLKIVEKIQRGDQAIDISQIPFGIWSIRAKTLDLRKDPELLPPKELVAVHFRSPMIIESSSRLSDNLSQLPLATAGQPAAGGGGAGLGGVGVGGGAAGGRDGGLGLGDLEGGDISGGREGDRGGERGGAVGGGDDSSRSAGRSDSEPPEVGLAMNGMHEKFFPGIRPNHFGMSNNLEQVAIFDTVVVTGLIEVQKQFESFQSSFADSIGYFPNRDKVDYKFLQVERRKVVPDADPQVWEDISDQIQAWREAIPNRLISMPQAEHRSAPEVIAEEAYDPILTSPIPALTMIDYREMFTHPKVGHRIFDALPKSTKTTGPSSGNDLFARDQAKPEEQTPTEIVRAGSDLSRYFKTVESRKPPKEYKLVRFFDLSPKKSGETYEYRVRAWLFDPNHDPPEEETAGSDPARGGGGRPGGGSGGLGGIGVDGGGMAPGGRGGGARGAGGRAGAAGGISGDMGDDGRGQGIAGGRGGRGNGAGGTGVGGGQSNPNDPDEGEENYVEIPITPQMKHPDVRSRLAAARKEEDPQDKTKFRYFIEENGYAEPIEIPANKLDLRTARPTPWSEVVQVKIESEPANAIAGSIDYGGRPLKVGNFDLYETEPVAEAIVSVWNRIYRTYLPAKKLAYRGDLLDSNATAHLLDPISWEVRILSNAPVVSDAVLVDMMGGTELATPSTELMRYHLAREMLVLSPDGRFSIANDMDQRTEYRMSLFLEDESNEVGRRRRVPTPRASNSPERPGGGRGGESGF